MTASLSLTQSQALTDLRDFLLNYIPAGDGFEVIQAQDNKVPEPVVADFVVMTPTRRDRLATNIDAYVDCAFIGRVTGTVLVVSQIILGKITIGSVFFGQFVPVGSKITDQVNGTPGGVGTYTVTPSQQTPSSAIGEFVIGESPIGEPTAGVIMACGSSQMMQKTKFTVQLDVHGPNSADNSQIISTLFRDIAGYDFLTGLGHDVAPLYADDPRQIPFENEQQLIEWRWVIEAVLQINPIVLIPQQFADVVKVTLINVDEHYPPS